MSKNNRKNSTPAKAATPAKTVKTTAKAAAPAAKKSNSSLIALIVVLVVAVVVIGLMMGNANNLNAQMDELNNTLTSTQSTLKQTTSDKEALQEQLEAAQEQLDEANLTLQESTAKVATLEADLAKLTAENTANVEQIAALTSDLEAAKANQAVVESHVSEAMAAMQLALNAIYGVTPEPTAEPTVEPATSTDVDVVVEEPVVEEPVVEAPVVPVVTENEDGSKTITTETAIVTVTLDETGAIAAIKATVNETEIVEVALASFIGKTLPVDAADIELDEAVETVIIEALTVLATPVEAAA